MLREGRLKWGFTKSRNSSSSAPVDHVSGISDSSTLCTICRGQGYNSPPVDFWKMKRPTLARRQVVTFGPSAAGACGPILTKWTKSSSRRGGCNTFTTPNRNTDKQKSAPTGAITRRQSCGNPAGTGARTANYPARWPGSSYCYGGERLPGERLAIRLMLRCVHVDRHCDSRVSVTESLRHGTDRHAIGQPASCTAVPDLVHVICHA